MACIYQYLPPSSGKTAEEEAERTEETEDGKECYVVLSSRHDMRLNS